MGSGIHVWSLVLAVVVAVVSACRPAAAQQTISADRFVDAAGVNIHLHYDNTLYRDQFPLVKSRLLELGVRHVRDGLIDTTFQPYYDRLNELGRAGIKGLFVVGPHDSAELMASYPSRVPDCFEAYEAPNEYNASTDANWAQTLTQSLTRLRGLKNDPRAAAFPIYGPSLTTEQAYAALGDVSALYDIGNMHNYFAGRHPGTTGWGANGYGSIEWNLQLTGRHGSGKPIAATETGYQDDPKIPDSIPPRVIGRYMPIVLLEQFRAGVVRTYLYELADFANSGSYGLLHADGSPKPAFTAVKNLLRLLADPGAAFTPRDLPYTVQDASGTVRHLIFQKRNGTYFLAIWQAVPSWDPAGKRPMGTEARQTLIRFSSDVRVVRLHRWQPDGSVAAIPTSTRAEHVSVNVTDALTIIELTQTPQ